MKDTGYLIHNWRLVLPSGVTRGLKKKSFPGIPSDVESQLLYLTYVHSFFKYIVHLCIALRFEKLFHHILRCLTLPMIE